MLPAVAGAEAARCANVRLLRDTYGLRFGLLADVAGPAGSAPTCGAWTCAALTPRS